MTQLPSPPGYQPPIIPPKPKVSRWPGWLVGLVSFFTVLGVLAAGYVGFSLFKNRDSGKASTVTQNSPSANPSATPTVTPTIPGTGSVKPIVLDPNRPLAKPAELKNFYQQQLTWENCGGYQCSWLEVPLDYAEPELAKIKIRVLKNAAVESSKPNLVVNPGGPGGSGLEYAKGNYGAWRDQIRENYNVVGFDPRGIGESTPLKCLDTAGMDEFLAFDPDPETKVEARQATKQYAKFGRACLKRSGKLAAHISTREVIRDLDILRAALGDEKLNYLGASYGTLIGAMYADLFPKRVGRFVLDGAVDPSLSNYQLSLQQSKGFTTATRAYLRDCISKGDCFLGDTIAAGETKLAKFFQKVDRRPLPTGDQDRKLTIGNAVTGFIYPLYSQDGWPYLTDALKEAMAGNGAMLLEFADRYGGRGSDEYEDNSVNGLYAVNCLDHSDSIPVTQVPKYFAEFTKASPVLGKTFAYSLATCKYWPVKSGQITKAVQAVGAAPIVVVGTTRDPATPYLWSVSLAKQLRSGVLVTRDGDGHTGYNQNNSCVDSAVEDYLIAGKVPEAGTRC